MALTDWLAIEGAVIGTLAFALTVRKEWRDRPKLSIDAGASLDVDGKNPRITITVENHGRQSVIIREVGFICDAEPGVLPETANRGHVT